MYTIHKYVFSFNECSTFSFVTPFSVSAETIYVLMMLPFSTLANEHSKRSFRLPGLPRTKPELIFYLAAFFRCQANYPLSGICLLNEMQCCKRLNCKCFENWRIIVQVKANFMDLFVIDVKANSRYSSFHCIGIKFAWAIVQELLYRWYILINQTKRHHVISLFN